MPEHPMFTVCHVHPCVVWNAVYVKGAGDKVVKKEVQVKTEGQVKKEHEEEKQPTPKRQRKKSVKNSTGAVSVASAALSAPVVATAIPIAAVASPVAATSAPALATPSAILAPPATIIATTASDPTAPSIATVVPAGLMASPLTHAQVKAARAEEAEKRKKENDRFAVSTLHVVSVPQLAIESCTYCLSVVCTFLACRLSL